MPDVSAPSVIGQPAKGPTVIARDRASRLASSSASLSKKHPPPLLHHDGGAARVTMWLKHAALIECRLLTSYGLVLKPGQPRWPLWTPGGALFTTTAKYQKVKYPPRPKPPPDEDITEVYLKGSGPGGQKIV